jgi:hypothetical protein
MDDLVYVTDLARDVTFSSSHDLLRLLREKCKQSEHEKGESHISVLHVLFAHLTHLKLLARERMGWMGKRGRKATWLYDMIDKWQWHLRRCSSESDEMLAALVSVHSDMLYGLQS